MNQKTQKDISKSKKKPISLHPLNTEEALKDLLNTPFKRKRKKKSIEVEKKKN